MPIVVLFKSCCIYWFLQLQRENTIFTKHPNIDDLGRNDYLITFTWQGLCIGLRKWKKNTICGGNDHIVYARLLRFVCPGENNIIQTLAGPNNSISQLKTSAGNVCFSTQPVTRESEIPSTANNPPQKNITISHQTALLGNSRIVQTTRRNSDSTLWVYADSWRLYWICFYCFS